MNEKKSTIKLSLAMIFLLLMAGLVYVCSYADIGHKNVIINEVCSYNDAVIYDTSGICHDYIELYNPTDEVMDISGFYLSDNKDDLKKFILPEGTMLVSGEYLLLWAGTESEEVFLKDERLYTKFALRAGETLFLSDAQGEIIDKVKIPSETVSGTAYSRISISNEVWRLTKASPEEKNSIEAVEKTRSLKAEVTLSAEGGFYEEPFYLEMSTNKSCDIYYTLDGSAPTMESIKYEGPILIEDISYQENKYASRADISLLYEVYIPVEPVTKATVIRAAAIDKRGRVSEETKATYFVGFEEKSGFENIPVISLITEPENFFGYENGIYVNGQVWDINKEIAIDKTEYWQTSSPVNYTCKGTGWRKETTLQYYDENRELLYEQQVGIGIHGRTSASYNQKSLNLTALPEADGNEYVLEGLFGKNETSLMLRNGGGDCHGSKLRDVLTQDLVKGRSLTVSDFQPCQVFLDGEYWGLYMIQERVGESMIFGQYDIPEENVIALKVNKVIAGEETDSELWDEVMDFVKVTDLSVTENYEKVEQMIDIQSCIDHYAFQVYVANRDALRNNQAKWRVKELGDGLYEDGKWRWFIYDVDASTGSMLSLSGADTDSFIGGSYWWPIFEDELFGVLIKNEEFKQRFITSFMDMANYNFAPERVTARIDELARELTEATVASQQRFLRPNYKVQNYETEINEIRQFFLERYEHITAYVKPNFNLEGELVPITVENAEGGKVHLNTLTLESDEGFKGKYYSDYEITLSAEPSEGYEFKGWMMNGEHISETEVSLHLDQEYVIMPVWEEIQ